MVQVVVGSLVSQKARSSMQHNSSAVIKTSWESRWSVVRCRRRRADVLAPSYSMAVFNVCRSQPSKASAYTVIVQKRFLGNNLGNCEPIETKFYTEMGLMWDATLKTLVPLVHCGQNGREKTSIVLGIQYLRFSTYRRLICLKFGHSL